MAATAREQRALLAPRVTVQSARGVESGSRPFNVASSANPDAITQPGERYLCHQPNRNVTPDSSVVLLLPCEPGGSTVPAPASRVRSANFPSAQGRTNFAQAFDPKNNAFGFFRLSLAIAVIFSHAISLGGFGIDPLESLTNGRYTIGLISVAMFFVLSGFLICRSASNSRSVSRFLWHRFLRIFPGYWVCLIVCGCVIAPLMAFTEFGTPTRVFSVPWNSSQSFMLSNAGLFHLNGFSLEGILFIRPNTIAGLLRHNPVQGMVNGSLWTLPFEVSCYVAVALLAAVGVLRRARLVVLGLFAGLWCFYAFDWVNPNGFWRCFPHLGIKQAVMLCLYFSAGCVCFLYREKIPYSPAIFVASLVALGGSVPVKMFGLIAPVAMPYAFLCLAFALPFRSFDRKGDFSYGTYIYAFPVQQGMALLGIQEKGFGLYFVSSLFLIAVLAFLSYRLIEAPCLKLKSVQMSRFRRRGLSSAQLRERLPTPPAEPAIS
jgi:peptidoglycan/LPS O-acetylase OafA/YrhL